MSPLAPRKLYLDIVSGALTAGTLARAASDRAGTLYYFVLVKEYGHETAVDPVGARRGRQLAAL